MDISVEFTHQIFRTGQNLIKLDLFSNLSLFSISL